MTYAIVRPGSLVVAPDIHAVIDLCQLPVRDGDAAVDEGDFDSRATAFGREPVEPHGLPAPIKLVGRRQRFEDEGVDGVDLQLRPMQPQAPMAGARLHEKLGHRFRQLAIES